MDDDDDDDFISFAHLNPSSSFTIPHRLLYFVIIRSLANMTDMRFRLPVPPEMRPPKEPSNAAVDMDDDDDEEVVMMG